MSLEDELTAEKPLENNGSAIGDKEKRFFDNPAEPNTFKFNFGIIKGSYNPENSIAIFAIVGLVLLCLTLALIAIAAIWHPPVATWTEKAKVG